MTQRQTTRRQFLRSTGAAAGLSLASVHLPALLPLARAAAAARDAGAGFKNLSSDDAADIEALCAQVIPTDDTPGAREAGVVYFIDNVIGGEFAHMRESLIEELAGINAMAGKGTRFAELDSARQVALMEAADDAGGLGMIVTLTLFGMFSMPVYGGNRNHVGWDLIGFDHRHAWFPPFGHYDAKPDDDADGGVSADGVSG
ncbi:MAG: gluconate 2-dehydrogenase subunit 3 family protein [Pseudomonadota bacterium]